MFSCAWIVFTHGSTKLAGVNMPIPISNSGNDMTIARSISNRVEPNA
jgi:hypothetical protein